MSTPSWERVVDGLTAAAAMRKAAGAMRLASSTLDAAAVEISRTEGGEYYGGELGLLARMNALRLEETDELGRLWARVAVGNFESREADREMESLDLLEDAGWTQRDGFWWAPDGKRKDRDAWRAIGRLTETEDGERFVLRARLLKDTRHEERERVAGLIEEVEEYVRDLFPIGSPA